MNEESSQWGNFLPNSYFSPQSPFPSFSECRYLYNHPMPPSKKRPAMIASVVRSVVAPFLRECPQACGIVSLTDIEVSDDVNYATCYVSALTVPEQAIAFLQSRIPELKKAMGAALQMYRAPFLRFRIDPRTERGGRIDRLLEGGR